MEIIFHLVLLSHLFLSTSLIISNSYYLPLVFAVSCISLLFLFVAFLRSLKASENSFLGFDPFPALIFSTLFSQVLYFWGLSPVFQGWPESKTVLFGFQGLALCLTFLFAFSRRKTRWMIFFAVLLGMEWWVSSFWVLNRLPYPTIDVWVFSQEAVAALLRGENPYSLVFNVPADNPFTPVTHLYAYPPLSLLLSIPSYLVTGDVRYSGLFCQMGAAICLYGIARKSGKEPYLAILIAALFLFHPRWHYVLQQAWTEPFFIVFLFTSVYFYLIRRFNLFGFFAGVFFSAKQYLLFLPPFHPFYFRAPRKAYFLSAAVFLAFLLPFFIASPADFYRNLIQYHLEAPFRTESLGLPSFLYQTFSWKPLSWLPFAAAGIVMLVGSKKKGPLSFSLAASLAFFLFFWLNKQAFLNYYFFVQAFMALTLALIPTRPKEQE